MTWFKYFKSSESISSSVANSNYSYAFCKRFINNFTPRDTLSENFWLFVNIENISINTYQTSSLESSSDDHSYIVVYEKENTFTPVKTVIEDNYLYFQTAEEHTGQEEITGRYAIYYSTPNLRKIKSVNNGGQTDYQINLSEYPFFIEYNEVSTSSYEVTLDSISSYNFSFINSFKDWDNGATEKPGSKAYVSFTGPSIYIYGGKSTLGGKFKVKVTGLPDKNYNSSTVEVEDYIVDTYSSVDQSNVILYQNTSLQERDYIIEIENLYDKNLLSSGNKLELSKYAFKYNLYLSLNKELINQLNNTFTLIAGVR